ncbi:hypothetical protein ACFY05_40040 [Microtetraspora fusca]|uniref:Phosphatase PAP2 family protein n=1 Tax=Microtetraspora fusca TaxID=1997 RepID=A0ABW6VMN2_MICFU
MRQGRVAARAVTEVFAPAPLVIGLPLVVGATTNGWAGVAWGAVASGLCGGIPAVVIRAGVRSGRFSDRHIGDRKQRPWLIGVIVALVVLTLLLLAALGAPRVMVAAVAAMLATLAIVGPVTHWWKISFHTAVASGSVVFLAHIWPALPVYLVGGLLVAVIAWGRVRLGDHTAAQAVAGAAAGAAATWGTLAALVP